VFCTPRYCSLSVSAVAICRCVPVPVPETSPCCRSFASIDALTCVTNALPRACFYGVRDYVLMCCVFYGSRTCVHEQRKKTRPSGTSGNRRPSKGPAASSFFRRARRKAKRSCPYPSAHAGGADDDDDDDDDDDTVASGSDWDLNTLSPGCGSVGNASPTSFSSSCSDSGAGLDVRLVQSYCCFLSVEIGSSHIQWPSRMPLLRGFSNVDGLFTTIVLALKRILAAPTSSERRPSRYCTCVWFHIVSCAI